MNEQWTFKQHVVRGLRMVRTVALSVNAGATYFDLHRPHAGANGKWDARIIEICHLNDRLVRLTSEIADVCLNVSNVVDEWL
jgi:hypothetical protein